MHAQRFNIVNYTVTFLKCSITFWIALTLFLINERIAYGTELTKVSFIPQWVPQAQFAGYYVAHEHGFYKKYGIDLTIIPGGPERQPSDYLKSRKADYASLWLASAIQMRAAGVKIVNIAQIMQRSALMLVAKKGNGIKTVHDINGKKVGLWSPIFQIQPRALFRKYDLTVRVIRQSYSVDLFLRDGVDIASAMWYNEYHTILNSGLNPDELTTFFFHEQDLNFPEDGIYTLENTFNKDPDVCKSFVMASIQGWRYAFANPEEALDIVMKNLRKEHIPASYVHQKWMLERMTDLIIPADLDLPIGTLQPDDYYRVAQGLEDNKLISRIPEFSSFYRMCNSYVQE